MATLYVDTDAVSPSPPTYSTLAAAVAALPATLTEPYVIECSGATADITPVDIKEVATTAANSITIVGQGIGAGRIDDSKYRLTLVGRINYAAILCSVSNVTLHNIQGSRSGAGSYNNFVFACHNTALSNIKFSSLLGTNSSTGTTSRGGLQLTAGDSQILNCVFYSCIGYGITTRNAPVSNCVSIDAEQRGFYSALWRGGLYRNCIAINSGYIDFTSGASLSSSNNISSDATAQGANSLINQVSTDLFTDPTNGDFTLKAGSNAIGAGVDLSALFTTDITGATRTTPWDIGAFMYAVAAGLLPPTNLRVVQISPTETRLEWDAPI